MATTAPSRPPRRRGPATSRRQRPCSICRAPAGPFGAIPIADTWVCARCFRSEAGPEPAAAPAHAACAEEATQPATSALTASSTQSAVLERIHRIDRAQQAICFGLRTLVYAALALWSARSATGAALFSGFLLADTLTWLGATALDIRFHKVAAGADLVLYMLAASIWLSLDRTWTLPGDASLRACTWLMFAMVAFVKTGWTIQRYVVSDTD